MDKKLILGVFMFSFQLWAMYEPPVTPSEGLEAIKLGYCLKRGISISKEAQGYKLVPSVEESWRAQNQDKFEDYSWAVDSQEMAPLYIKIINDVVGRGVFAAEPIDKDDVIGEYAGTIYHEDERKRFQSDEYTWQIGSGPLVVDAHTYGNELRFVNHSSDNPNVVVEFFPYKSWYHTMYIVKKSIDRDEQLLIDYGPHYWLARENPCNL